MQTAPEIRRTIIWKLHNWRQKRRIKVQITKKYGECEASEHQDMIGWTNLMLGRLAPEWAAAQQTYLDWLGRRKTGKCWLIALTVKLLNISHGICGTTRIKFSITAPIRGKCSRSEILTDKLKISMNKGTSFFNGRTIGHSSQ
jgi:hypothetical protein